VVKSINETYLLDEYEDSVSGWVYFSFSLHWK
jgi:hypothetical protein